MGNGHLRVVVHEQMDMVVLAIELYQFRFKVVAYSGKDAPQIVEYLFGEDLPPVFCDEDQVHMHHEDAVSSVPNVIAFLHRPRIYCCPCNGFKPSNTRSSRMTTSGATCAASPGHADSSITRRWGCRRRTMKQETSSSAM